MASSMKQVHNTQMLWVAVLAWLTGIGKHGPPHPSVRALSVCRLLGCRPHPMACPRVQKLPTVTCWDASVTAGARGAHRPGNTAGGEERQAACFCLRGGGAACSCCSPQPHAWLAKLRRMPQDPDELLPPQQSAASRLAAIAKVSGVGEVALQLLGLAQLAHRLHEVLLHRWGTEHWWKWMSTETEIRQATPVPWCDGWNDEPLVSCTVWQPPSGPSPSAPAPRSHAHRGWQTCPPLCRCCASRRR